MGLSTFFPPVACLPRGLSRGLPSLGGVIGIGTAKWDLS